MKRATHAPCPCQSGRKIKRCCGPILSGTPASSPEALMRSRFTAYALGDVGHIIATTHPTSPHRMADSRRWAQEIQAFCSSTAFSSLTVHGSDDQDLTGWVHFTAGLQLGGVPQEMTEHSTFYKIGDRWLYHSARTD